MPRKIKGYSRVDSDDAHGWLVRIKRGDTRRSRFISDATHGGKRKSMLIAQQLYRDWTDELPEPETSAGKVGVRNSTGIVGVHFARDIDARYPSCVYESYVASWLNEDGRRRNVRFSCSKYGEDEARALAAIARQQQISDREKVESIFERIQKLKSAKKKQLLKAKLVMRARKPAAKKK